MGTLRVEARAPLTRRVGGRRGRGGPRLLRTLTRRAFARVVIAEGMHASIIADPLARAVAAALLPGRGVRVQLRGPAGPGWREARALALLGALNALAVPVRSPAQLAAAGVRLARRLELQLDEPRMLGATVGGLVLVRETPDGYVAAPWRRRGRTLAPSSRLPARRRPPGRRPRLRSPGTAARPRARGLCVVLRAPERPQRAGPSPGSPRRPPRGRG